MPEDHSEKPIRYHQLSVAGKRSPILDFKLLPCSECCMLSSEYFSASEFRRRGITQKKAYNKKPHCSLGYLITNLLT